MKKFIEELNKSTTYMRNAVPTNTEADRQFGELKEKYSNLVGRRALYTSKIDKDTRVVVIEEVHKKYIVLSYKYYGMDYEGKTKTCVTYQSLICGDSRLDVE